MTCAEWLEQYIKSHQPITPTAVYKAGSKVGFTRADIKKARRWQGKYIDTQINDGTTLWRWNP